MRGQYDAGADPAIILQDLLDLTHWLTTLKLAPEAGQDVTTSETERVRGRAMAAKLGMPALTKVWQMLLKGLGELRQAPAPLAAAEMVLLRISFAAELPDPADLVRRLSGATGTTAATPPSAPSAAPAAQPVAGPTPAPPALQAAVGDDPRPEPTAVAADPPPSGPDLEDFAAVAQLFGERRELRLQAHLVNDVHLVHFAPGRIALRPSADAPRNLIPEVQQKLSEWTGRRWVVSVSSENGQPTLGQARADQEQSRRDEVEAHPLVRQARAVFPGAELRAIRTAGAIDNGTESGPDMSDEESEI